MCSLTIGCISCGQRWAVPSTYSVYEQQSVESCPCPACGAYTLCCQGEASEGVAALIEGDRALAAAGSRY